MSDMLTTWMLLGAFVTAALVIRYLNTASDRPTARAPLRYVRRPVPPSGIPVVRYCSPAPAAGRTRLQIPAGRRRCAAADRGRMTTLVPLCAIGVFVDFTLAQTAMVRH
ncbi:MULTISPECIES: hypothetical protein [Rhodococcus]|uniref:hypothetical protein n=1 Tax=Rhodococcus TaxID=1827 RepID=UPI00193BE61B|nr:MULTISPECIES: hypothetical protein [Rhodococcus]QRI76871.1 hypothetical protein JQ505_03530 [Rhodococcus aetherivorans]QSE60288.1 hypothetical protein JYA75_04645 [Rhodococcus sp. PSBB066]QSE68406.1 hypothetical protein JYA91_22950 [Rhodococcus sp. PSBB049]